MPDAGACDFGFGIPDFSDMAEELLSDKTAYEKMAKAVNPYGDGFASERIVKAILEKVAAK